MKRHIERKHPDYVALRKSPLPTDQPSVQNSPEDSSLSNVSSGDDNITTESQDKHSVEYHEDVTDPNIQASIVSEDVNLVKGEQNPSCSSVSLATVGSDPKLVGSDESSFTVMSESFLQSSDGNNGIKLRYSACCFKEQILK